MAAPELAEVVTLLEALGCVGANRLEEDIAHATGGIVSQEDERSVHEPREVVQRAPWVVVVLPDDLLRGGEGERPREHGEGPEHPLLALGEEVVTPVERTPEGPLAVGLPPPPPGQ